MEGRFVLVVIWDGLRPDFVSPQVTPTLHHLAAGGVWFEASHCAYPSETRVNATALATGCYPGRTGITANTLIVPGFDPAGRRHLANTGDHTHLARLAELDGPLVHVPGVADALAEAGGVMAVASSGSPGSAYLQNPRQDGITVNPALLRPRWVEERVMAQFGPPPAPSRPATGRSAWIAHAVLDFLLPDVIRPAVQEGRPALLHWWHTDPDHTAHTFGLGSRQTVQSLRENDRWLAALHHRLHSLGLAEQTDVLLTSDHGFSTAGVPQGFEQGLLDAGWREAPHGEDLVTTGQGGGSIYLHRRAYDGAPRLVRWLQAQPWIGAIFARDDGPAAGVEGTLPLSAAWNGRLGPRAPDVKFSPGWTEEANAAGVPGTALAGNGRGASHGSASPYDMRNALFAWGPRFAQRVRSTTPAGIVDVAPTVRHLLGLPQLPADGRVLTEALDGQPDTAAAAFSEETHQASATWPGGRFQQRLFLARVGTTTYLRRVEADHH